MSTSGIGQGIDTAALTVAPLKNKPHCLLCKLPPDLMGHVESYLSYEDLKKLHQAYQEHAWTWKNHNFLSAYFNDPESSLPLLQKRYNASILLAQRV
jgi:hypothetical protein